MFKLQSPMSFDASDLPEFPGHDSSGFARHSGQKSGHRDAVYKGNTNFEKNRERRFNSKCYI